MTSFTKPQAHRLFVHHLSAVKTVHLPKTSPGATITQPPLRLGEFGRKGAIWAIHALPCMGRTEGNGSAH